MSALIFHSDRHTTTMYGPFLGTTQIYESKLKSWLLFSFKMIMLFFPEGREWTSELFIATYFFLFIIYVNGNIISLCLTI